MIGIVAVGMTFVILTGGIDLSVGSVAGLTGIILGLAVQNYPLPVAILLAVASGAGIGLISGLLIAYFSLAPFVVTLGMMAIGRSLALHPVGADRDFQHSVWHVGSGLYRYPGIAGQCAVPVRALSGGLGLSDLHQGRAHDLRGRLQQGGGAGGGTGRVLLLRAPYVVSGALAAVAVTFSIAQLSRRTR